MNTIESFTTRRIALAQPGQSDTTPLYPETDRATPNPEFTVSDLYDRFLAQNPQAKEKFQVFMDRVNTDFEKQEAEFITRALKIATVAHQFNWNLKDRFRKEKDPRSSEPIPYIYHPLEMAEMQLTHGIRDWLIISATLLHDVAEDCNLGEGMEGREAWYSIIKNEYQDSGQGELLAQLIGGATEQKLLPIDTAEGIVQRQRLRETQIYKMFSKYVESGQLQGSKKRVKTDESMSPEVEEAVLEVVYNLEHLFAVALQSPKHLRLFFIKIADIWHNYQSITWVKEAKILRGRIASSLAEWMGWFGMRSEIMRLMADVIDTASPFSPAILVKVQRPQDTKSNLREELDQTHRDCKKILETRFANIGFQNFSLEEGNMVTGWPMIVSGSSPIRWKNSEEIDTTLCVPDVVVTLGRDQLEEYRQKFRIAKRKEKLLWCFLDSIPSTNPLPINFSGKNNKRIPTLVNLFGRDVTYLPLRVGGRKSLARLRLESDEPRIVDYFGPNRNGVRFENIPEGRGLFHSRLKDTPLWDFHLSALIGFFYDPNLAVFAGKEVFLVFHDGALHFISGSQNVGEIMKALQLDPERDKLMISDKYNKEYTLEKDQKLRGFLGKRKMNTRDLLDRLLTVW